MTFLGLMFSCDRGIWRDDTLDRALARQMFGLTEEQAQHPHLCFEELGQSCQLWEIIVFAAVFPRKILRCYLKETGTVRPYFAALGADPTIGLDTRSSRR